MQHKVNLIQNCTVQIKHITHNQTTEPKKRRSDSDFPNAILVNNIFIMSELFIILYLRALINMFL